MQSCPSALHISLSLKKKAYWDLSILRVLLMAPSVTILKGFDRITRSIRSVISNSRRNINYTDSNLFSDLTHRSIESWRQVRSLDILPLRWTILQLNWILANQFCKQLGTEALPLPDLFSLVSVVLLLIVLQKRMAWRRSRGTQRGRLPPKFITEKPFRLPKVFLDLWKCILSGAIKFVSVWSS